jgi:hypothetical protein
MSVLWVIFHGSLCCRIEWFLEQREVLFEYLRALNRKSASREVSTLIKNIQFGLLGKNPATLNPALAEPYAAIWE